MSEASFSYYTGLLMTERSGFESQLVLLGAAFSKCFATLLPSICDDAVQKYETKGRPYQAPWFLDVPRDMAAMRDSLDPIIPETRELQLNYATINTCIYDHTVQDNTLTTYWTADDREIEFRIPFEYTKGVFSRNCFSLCLHENEGISPLNSTSLIITPLVGGSSTVYRCLHKGKTEWACKVFKKIQLREVFETDDEIQLVLESRDRRGTVRENRRAGAIQRERRRWSCQTNIVCLEENLLYETEYENSKLKLADFGLSKFLKNGSYTMNTLCGTVGYCAPEILLNKEYDLSVDLWSVGVVMYIMLCGYEPFWDDTGEIGMCKRVVEGEFEFSSPWWDDISDSAKDLISQLLQLEPSSRPTASEALEHPWVKGETPRCTNMASVVKRLREFNAKRKFRAATHAVLATRRAMYLISPERRLTKGLTSPQC
uniref:Protein kinase domain-containing protein n=1 Tax=Timema bartmani TaxID=61472 RepID=A0A7R9EWL7_9NEOP|nr:unnamed protein product [Timema bartmani]